MEYDLFNNLTHTQIALIVVAIYVVIRLWNAFIDSEVGVHTPFQWAADLITNFLAALPCCRHLKNRKLHRMREIAEERYLAEKHRDKRRLGMPEKGLSKDEIEY